MALPSQRPERLHGLALCAGVGGLELGLHVAEPGYRTVCYVERDSFAAATLVARMADKALCDAPVWDDVTKFDGRRWRGAVDIVTAGYPCQPFSSAGHRLGTDDPRHLWPHVGRIIDEVRPTWALLENVLGHVDLGFDIVAGELQRMGYHVEAGLFSAAEVGASHWRTRLFILAHANGCAERKPARVRLRPKRGSDKNTHQPQGQTAGVVRSLKVLDSVLDDDQGTQSQAGTGDTLPLFAPSPFDLQAWHAALAGDIRLQPCLHGLDDGLAHRMERSAASGNGVVSLAAAYAWRTLRDCHARRAGLS